ncbi:MAG: DUF2971 domain-containing protein [Pseudomonadales bacterium]
MAKYRPEMNREARQKEARLKLSDPNSYPRSPENLSKFREMYQETVTSKVGVMCISEIPDDILMWSHYSDSHKGICIVLDRKFLPTAHPVNYEKSRPTVNPIIDTPEVMLDRSMFTKSDHWFYEKEWRVLQYERGASAYQFPEKILVGILLGAQISEENKLLVHQWAEQSPSKPWVKQVFLSPTEFKITI